MGTYAIGQGDLTAGKNYDLTFRAANLTVTARPITVTADPQTKVYGDADPKLTHQLSQGSLHQDDGFSGDADPLSDVGPYQVTATGLSGRNYAITYVPGSLQVTPAPLSVKADGKTKEYGEANPSLSGTLAGVKNGDDVTASYTTGADLTSGVGPYAIVAKAVGGQPGHLWHRARDGHVADRDSRVGAAVQLDRDALPVQLEHEGSDRGDMPSLGEPDRRQHRVLGGHLPHQVRVLRPQRPHTGGAGPLRVTWVSRVSSHPAAWRALTSSRAARTEAC